MGRSAPWTQSIHRILAEEGPQPWHVLMERAGVLVPPGQAYREHVRQRESNARLNGTPAPARPKPGDQAAIRSGRRSIISKALHQERRRGFLTYDSAVPTDSRVVAGTSCPCCGRPLP